MRAPELTKTPVAPQVVRSSLRLSKEYVLAVGDQIEVSVRRSPEVTRTVVIRPDGRISLPVAGEVVAAGRTALELSGDIKTLLSARLIEPEVTVIATNTRQPSVYVTGDLNSNALALPLRSASTAMQAIVQAGGFRKSAAQRDVAVIRLNEKGYLEAIVIEADKAKGQPVPAVALAGFPLEADDIVFVPESNRGQLIRMLDDFVNRPLTSLNLVFQPYLAIRYIQTINR